MPSSINSFFPAILILAGVVLIGSRFVFYFGRHIWRGERLVKKLTHGYRPIHHRQLGLTYYLSKKLVNSALTVGFIRPKIIVAADLPKSLSRRELTAVIGHERAHVQGYDPFWHGLADSINTAVWRPPWPTKLVQTLMTWRELSADAAATDGYRQTAGLSGAIIKLHGTEPLSDAIGFSPNNVRVNKLLDRYWQPRIDLWRPGYLAALMAALMIWVFAWRLVPVAAATPPPNVIRACQVTELICAKLSAVQVSPDQPVIFSCAGRPDEFCPLLPLMSEYEIQFPVR